MVKRKTALDIYREGYRMTGGNTFYIFRSASKQFFRELGMAIVRELEEEGSCQLIEELLNDRESSIDIVVGSVFYVLEKTDFEGVEKCLENVGDFVPGFRVTWEDCDSQRIFLKDDGSFKRRVSEVREKFQKTASSPACGRDRRPDRKGSEIVRNAEKVKEEARKEAEKIKEEARREAEKIKEEARKEAEKILERARENEKEAEHKRAEGDKILAKAKNEAQDITASVMQQAEEMIKDARRKAEEATSRVSDGLLRQHILESQRKLKSECSEEVEKAVSSHKSEMKRIEEIHGEMCEKTNALQAVWVKSMEKTVESLNDIKKDFYRQIHEWQSSVYISETRGIAERFLELYRIINVDRLIREEVVFQYLQEHQQEKASDESCADEKTPETSLPQQEERTETVPLEEQNPPSSKTVEALQKLNKNLTIFLRRFEASLNDLGLYAYYPKEGEAYDEIWHMAEDEEDSYEGRIVAECVLPGIAKKTGSDYGDEAVIQAIVRLRE